MSQEENIKKWLNGELSPEEEKAFLNSPECSDLRKLSDNLNGFKAPEYKVEEQLNRFKKSYSEASRQDNVRRINWFAPALRIAAAITILAVVYFTFFVSNSEKFITGAGETAEIYLPDSSLVVLNAGSSLEFNPDKWSEKREVLIDGEAYFKVSKGSRFDVRSEEGVVSVLGTQFNVRSRLNFYEVICFEGKVGVKTSTESYELLPSDAFRLIDGNFSFVSAWNEEEMPSWLSNISSFESVPFQYVIDEFKRQYDIKVQVESVNTDKLFTGSFRNDDMELALQSITIPLKIKFEITDQGTVILKGDQQ